MSDPIPFLDLDAQIGPLTEPLVEAFENILKSKAFCLGPEVEAFEEELKTFTGLPYAVGVNTGTSALHLVLLALGVGEGDEVILPAMSFIATAWAVSYVGATPVFVDIDPGSRNLDPRAVEVAMTSKTRAVIAVHLYGIPAPMVELKALCDAHDCHLVEDAAQALGATLNDQEIGSWGDAACISFYPGKNLGALGEGGAIVTANESIYRMAVSLRNHGTEGDRYRHVRIGYNYRMDGIQAAALRIKLPYLRDWLQWRRERAHYYTSRLSQWGICSPTEPKNTVAAWHLYVIQVESRDAVLQHLQENGIGAGLHYPVPLHLQPCYQFLGYAAGSRPHAESLGNTCLSLPLYPELKEAAQDRVMEVLKRGVEQVR